MKTVVSLIVSGLFIASFTLQAWGLAPSQAAVKLTPSEQSFFESKIRPLLIKHCQSCHSSEKTPMGGLQLDSRKGWMTGGSRGSAIVPGQPEQSLLIQAIRYQDPELAMPPQGILSPQEIEALEQWVLLGAPDPRAEPSGGTPKVTIVNLEKGRRFWSFQPLDTRPLPAVKDSSWISSPLDYFVLSRLEEKEMKPVRPADRRTWIRRATFDLIGLPPTLAEVKAFLEDDAPNAYEKVVDRLLASPHYGERWARHWLDVARYAEEQVSTSGTSATGLPYAYKYRDWVIKALNQDLPYDQFILQQFAGDQIKDLGEDGQQALGFFSLGPIYVTDGGDDKSKLRNRYETIDDKIDTLSRGILGLTVSCARCHDHKFDPVSTKDYYSLAGVFYNSRYAERHWVSSVEESSRYEYLEAQIKDQSTCIGNANRIKTNLPAEQVAENEKQQKVIDQLTKTRETIKKKLPPVPEHVHTLVEGGAEDIPVAVQGDPVQAGEKEPRQFLRVIAGDNPTPFSQGSGRLELAQAIIDPANPLTARVIVNRIWQHHFGHGLVRTPSNFGAMGERPSHPQLLDWLARRFIQMDWSIKRLHRQIMLSSTYKLSSYFDQSNFEVDGENRLLWRMNPRRMDVEAWRDSLLAVAGEQNLQMGGPPVKDILDSNRRTLYAPIRRDSRFPSDKFLRLFDFPNAWLSSSQRTTSTVPQQQLFLLNSQFMVTRAKAFYQRLSVYDQQEERIQQAFQLALSRPPSPQEIALALEFLQKSQRNGKKEAGLNPWEQYTQVLLSSNEFLHIR